MWIKKMIDQKDDRSKSLLSPLSYCQLIGTDLRILVSFFTLCFLTVLYGFKGAVLDACEALLAGVVPGRFAFYQFQVAHRANTFA